MNQEYDYFDGFTVNLFRDDSEDFLAHFVEMPNISAFGNTPQSALEELRTAWELVKEDYQESGEDLPIAPSRKKYSGQFNIRIDTRVHRLLAMEAARSGISLNALVAQKLNSGYQSAS